MTIRIGIDVHKKKCVATLKSDSKEILEQTSFYNNSKGINKFIKLITKGYGEENVLAVCESPGNYWIIDKRIISSSVKHS
jgi:transposase